MKLPITAMAVAALLVAGCSSPEEDIQSWMKEQSVGLKGQVKPLPEIAPAPVAEYDVALQADPFRPMKMEPDKRATGGLRPDTSRRREPLENFPLETINFVGILQKGGERVALVKVGDALYQVKRGNYLGQNFGMVTEITDGEVKLKELIEDLNGEWVEHDESLRLLEQQEKGK